MHLETLVTRQGILLMVMGLAGSGKSHYISRLYPEPDAICEEGFASNEEENIEKLKKRLSCGEYCVISELKYLNPTNREGFIEKVLSLDPQPLIRYVCFENNLDAANHNCRNRTNKGDPEAHVLINCNSSPAYQIPEGALVLPIHRLPAQLRRDA